MSQDPSYNRLIRSRKWRNLRVATLQAHPYCADCLRRGLKVEATEIHHIKPVESVTSESERQALMFDPSNLRCLCGECHRSAHRKLKSHTKEVHKERQRKRIEAVIKQFFPDTALPTDPGGDFLKGVEV